ncbi:MAG: hypothetical protein FJW34_16825 [Acidobacteria bacterium]|nr:hypothetical protein [Acidobacteriota bacterium]
MANEVTVTTADVRPLTGCIIRRAVAGEALALGDCVYVSSYSGDLPVVSKADGSAVNTANVYGVVVAGALANTTIASGESCDVVTLGPVTGYSSMTSGNTIWVSDTSGRLSTVVGTKSGVVGVAETPATVYVRPSLHTVSS